LGCVPWTGHKKKKLGPNWGTKKRGFQLGNEEQERHVAGSGKKAEGKAIEEKHRRLTCFQIRLKILESGGEGGKSLGKKDLERKTGVHV